MNSLITKSELKFRQSKTLIGGFHFTLTLCIYSFCNLSFAETLYSSKDLGSVWVYDVNNSGQVVGYYVGSSCCIQTQGFMTGPNGQGMIDIGLPGGMATAINNSGQVVGSSGGLAFITGPSGQGLTTIGVTDGYKNSYALGVNDEGRVAGYMSDGITQFNDAGFITGADGAGISRVQGVNQVVDVNNNGIFVGYAYNGGANRTYAIDSNGGISADIGTLGGLWTNPSGITDTNRIYGSSALSGFGFGYPFITNPGEYFISITNQITSSFYMTLMDVNTRGDYVGYLSDGVISRAFVKFNGANEFNWLDDIANIEDGYYWYAKGINDVGQIIAYGSNGHGYLLTQNYNLTPVPAPLPILGAVAAVGWSRKLRRRIKESQKQELT